MRLAQPEKTDRLPGSGIDVEQFKLTPLPTNHNRFRFLLIARMLWDKGVGEFVGGGTRRQALFSQC